MFEGGVHGCLVDGVEAFGFDLAAGRVRGAVGIWVPGGVPGGVPGSSVPSGLATRMTPRVLRVRV